MKGFVKNYKPKNIGIKPDIFKTVFYAGRDCICIDFYPPEYVKFSDFETLHIGRKYKCPSTDDQLIYFGYIPVGNEILLLFRQSKKSVIDGSGVYEVMRTDRENLMIFRKKLDYSCMYPMESLKIIE
jgi:hypothetical protein